MMKVTMMKKIGNSEGGTAPQPTKDKLKSFDFAYVVDDKKLKYNGLFRGDYVLLMGNKAVPASTRDPYLSRELFVVAKVVDGLPQIPKASNDFKAYLVDPRSLEWVGEIKQNEFEQNIKSRG